MKILTLFALMLLALPALADNLVAVLELNDLGNLDKSSRNSLDQSIREEIAAALPKASWSILPLAITRSRLLEAGLSAGDCQEDACFVSLGKELGVRLLIAPYFREGARDFKILLKLYDSRSEKLEAFVRVSGTDLKSLLNDLPDPCFRLFHSYRVQTENSPEEKVRQKITSIAPILPEGGIDHRQRIPEAVAEIPDLKRFAFGPQVATYSGPSHESLLSHINVGMSRMEGGSPSAPFRDLPVGVPFGFGALWRIKPPVALEANYSYASFETSTSFLPHEWESPRSLNTQLHELRFAFQYGLDFVRSRAVEPYLGGGVSFLHARSLLEIDLLNINEVTENQDNPGSPILPDRHFRVESKDTSLGAVAFVGLRYRLSPQAFLQAELMGTMGQITQNFEYEGSLQYIAPGSPPELFDDPEVNDILWGSYPLNLNGMKLSLSLRFEL
ncbi:MAG: outer membrane beta-barrel protein [Candidatus Krumholzibacteria bacterium]|nr:outer membrane beta-barrel protein [Candidatus Krumholzibacteria bacterium]